MGVGTVGSGAGELRTNSIPSNENQSDTRSDTRYEYELQHLMLNKTWRSEDFTEHLLDVYSCVCRARSYHEDCHDN